MHDEETLYFFSIHQAYCTPGPVQYRKGFFKNGPIGGPMSQGKITKLVLNRQHSSNIEMTLAKLHKIRRNRSAVYCKVRQGSTKVWKLSSLFFKFGVSLDNLVKLLVNIEQC